MTAYRLESVVNGTSGSGLYLYETSTVKSAQIAADTEAVKTSWSPSGKKIAITELDGKGYNSSIVYLR